MAIENSMRKAKEQTEEKAETVKTKTTQKATDEEILDTAKINVKRLDRSKMSGIVTAVVNFGELLSDMKMYPYQRELGERIIWSLILEDMATITGEFARQGGKSTTLSVVAPSATILFPILADAFEKANIKTNILRFKRGFFTGVYGPDYERAGIIGKRMNNIFNSATAKSILSDPEIGMKFPERLLYYLNDLPRNSFIKVRSANKRVSIEGDTYHLVIIDETQEVDDMVLKKSIEPFTSATGGTQVFLGSAYFKKVYFYDIIQQNKKSDVDKPKNKRNHYECTYHTVGKYNKSYKKAAEVAKRKLGEFSDEFRMSYELIWAIDKGMFITEDYLINEIGADYKVYSSDINKEKYHVVGVDLAKQHDSTVVTVLEVDYDNPILIDKDSGIVRYNKRIKNWLEINGDDYDSQYYQILDFLKNYSWEKMVVDATGVGSPIYDRLNNHYSRMGKVVVPFVYTRQSKSEIYSNLNKELLQKRVRFPYNADAKKKTKVKKFVQQMCNLSKSMVGAYLVVKHQLDTGLDDYPDSLALAVYASDTNENVSAEEVIDNIYRADHYRSVLQVSDKNFWRN